MMDYKNFFATAKHKNITNIQITEKTDICSNVEIINGKMESFDSTNCITYNIKAEYNEKTVNLATDYLNEEILDLIILKAENTDSCYSDEYLEGSKIIIKNKVLDFDIASEIDKLKTLDKLRQKHKEIQKITTYYVEEYTNTRIINSNSADISTDSHLCTFIVECIAQKGNEFTSYDQKQITTDKKELEFEKITDEVIEKTIKLCNKEKIVTGKYDIILDHTVASNILSNLTSMLSATNVRNKVSCLENKLEEQAFSELVNIIEDPTNNKYPGYRLFDDEGIETAKKDIVINGTIKTFLYNIKEAKLKNITSTGNAYQGINTKNMYLLPGNNTQQELFEQMKNGIYIIDYMGASSTSISTATGNISLQIFGFIIKDGQISSGIKPCILTTTIFELLKNVKSIGNDLVFTKVSSASPSLLIHNMSIAS